MLNPFPDLLIYSMLAPFILRVVVGIIFINLGKLLFRGENSRWIRSFETLNIPKPDKFVKWLGAVEIASGLMLIVGFYTQIAALILSIITFIEIYIEYKEPDILKRNMVFYVLIFSILMSILLSGAGSFAFDLPL